MLVTHEVDSEMILEAAYDTVERKLVLTFKKKDGSRGATWEYLGVPESVFETMLRAESVGHYFLHNIRGNYAERRIS